MHRISTFFRNPTLKVNKVQTFGERIKCLRLLKHGGICARDLVLPQPVRDHIFDRRQDNRCSVTHDQLDAAFSVSKSIEISA